MIDFSGYELVSLCGYGDRRSSDYWESYTLNLGMSSREVYDEWKTFWNIEPGEYLVVLQKTDYYDQGIRDAEHVGLVVRKQSSDKYVDIELNNRGVVIFNPQVEKGTVVRIKGTDTAGFLESYFRQHKEFLGSFDGVA